MPVDEVKNWFDNLESLKAQLEHLNGRPNANLLKFSLQNPEQFVHNNPAVKDSIDLYIENNIGNPSDDAWELATMRKFLDAVRSPLGPIAEEYADVIYEIAVSLKPGLPPGDPADLLGKSFKSLVDDEGFLPQVLETAKECTPSDFVGLGIAFRDPDATLSDAIELVLAKAKSATSQADGGPQ